MTNDRLLQALVSVHVFYERELTEFAIRIWSDALAEFDIVDIERAFALHLRDPERGQFAPKPADVIRQLRGDAKDAAQIAWTQVLIAVRAGGGDDFDGPTRRAIDSLGGLSVIGRAQEHENGFLQRRFVDAYLAHRRREESPPALLEGAEQPLLELRLKPT